MDKQKFNPELITSKLKYFRYRYRLDENTLKVYLPLLCYLKIKFEKDRVKMSSHIQFGFNPLSLEWNFIIYGLILILLSAYRWLQTEPVIFIGLGLLFLHFIICFIKTENLKIIIHNWLNMEEQTEKQ